MKAEEVERRRHRRVELGVPILLRQTQDETEATSFQEGLTKNISLAGVACRIPPHQAPSVGEAVVLSITIPYESRREFPFSRLAGRGRVVRVMTQELAIEFADDLTVLTAAPERA